MESCRSLALGPVQRGVVVASQACPVVPTHRLLATRVVWKWLGLVLRLGLRLPRSLGGSGRRGQHRLAVWPLAGVVYLLLQMDLGTARVPVALEGCVLLAQQLLLGQAVLRQQVQKAHCGYVPEPVEVARWLLGDCVQPVPQVAD